MKKILLIVVLSIVKVSFGQGNFKLGDYTKTISNKIEFKYKNPLNPFQKTEESYSSQGNNNLVSSYYTKTSNTVIVLQIYASSIPPKFKDIDWNSITNSDKISKNFINSFLGTLKNTSMKISKYGLVTINGKDFLEVYSTLTVSGVTQKQINWITVYKNNFINILGVTLIDSFDKNESFFKEFTQSVLIN